MEMDLVCPGSHHREVAGRIITLHLVNTGVRGEDGADNIEKLWFKVG